MAIAAAFFVFLLVLPAAYAVEYTVGDSSGWNQGVDYSTWATGKTFAVGDTLLFNYGGLHGVDVVSKSDYDNCATGNAITSYTDGNSKITLNRTGSMYFLCPAFGHCGGGMKLAVTVAAASNTPSGGSPSPTTPSPTTPSPDTPTPETPSTTTPSPKTPSTTTPTPTSGAAVNLYSMGYMVFGAGIVFAPLLGLMG